MQAGLWQSSCPSARLIMQERHSRPPFILPGGEAVPACSRYHMALAPLSFSSLLSSLALSLSTGGAVYGAGVVVVVEAGGLLVVWWNATARSIAFFLSSTLLFFSLFPLHFPFCWCEASEAGKKKKRETGVHLSCKETTTTSFFISRRRALTTAVARLGG